MDERKIIEWDYDLCNINWSSEMKILLKYIVANVFTDKLEYEYKVKYQPCFKRHNVANMEERS